MGERGEREGEEWNAGVLLVATSEDGERKRGGQGRISVDGDGDGNDEE